MLKLLMDITTGIDNQTHEITRVFMCVVMLIVVVVCLVGTVMEIWHARTTGQFDLQAYFQAYATFIPAIGLFILSGAGSIKLKSKSEPQTQEVLQ